MKTERWQVVPCSFLLGMCVALLSGCGPSLQAGGAIAQGRQALFRGDYPTAQLLFESAEQIDPNYIYGTQLREGTSSFLGRAQYLNRQLNPARATLQRALAQQGVNDSLTRLYLGLTLARQGDRQTGLNDIVSGMKQIDSFLNYITTAFVFSFGQYWDPAGDIRKSVAFNLGLIQQENFDWEALLSNSEELAMNFEQEPDRAQRQESEQLSRELGGRRE